MLSQHIGKPQHGRDQGQYRKKVNHEGPERCIGLAQTCAPVNGYFDTIVTKLEYEGGRGKSRRAICRQYGATDLHPSIQSPQIPRAYVGALTAQQ